MKKIYTFTINKNQEVEKELVSVNNNGEEVVTKKKTKEDVPYTFFLKQPSRTLKEEANLYYAKEVSAGLKEGLMSMAMLKKRYIDDGGIYSSKEKQEIEELQKKLEKLQEKNEKLASIEKKTKAQEQELKEIDSEFMDISSQLANMMSYEQDLFSSTAEGIAQKKVILFWILFLSYKEEGGSEVPVFGEGSFNDRIQVYDELSEKDDKFLNEVVNKLTYLVSVWSVNNGATKETFDDALKMFE